MIQIYFLSIFLNLAVGYVFVVEDEKEPRELALGFSFKDETIRLILGILSMVTGLLKLLSSVKGDVPVLGDLVPAVIGLGAGLILVLEYWRSRSVLARETKGTNTLDALLLGNKKIIGYAAFAAAVLHFLFPKVLLL